jgi:hypothetical protein
MPLIGVKVGVSTLFFTGNDENDEEEKDDEDEADCVEIIYGTDTVLLSSIPVLKALALIVKFVLTEIVLEATFDDDVGSELSVVYRIVAPLVAQEIDTDCVLEYAPLARLNVGEATCSC